MSMKKVFIFIISLLLIPINIFADTCEVNNISISSINMVEKSEYVEEVLAASVTGRNIDLDLTMFQPGDNIKYKVVLSNNSSEDFNITNNDLKVNSDYINYSFDINGDSTIKANSTKEIYLNVEYKNRVPEKAFETTVYNDINNMVVNLSADNNNPIIKILENPATGVVEHLPLLIFVIGFGVIAFILIKKKKYSKFMMILVIGTIIVPISAFTKCSCELNIKSNIAITKREPYMYIYYPENDGVTINKYLIKELQTNIEYTISDKNKCINYFTEEFDAFEYYDSTSDRFIKEYEDDELTYYASMICSGGADKYHLTLENYVFNMEESDYSLAGITNVSLTDKGTDIGVDVVIPTYIDGLVVKKISYDAFMRMGIKSVVLPEKIEIIDGYDDEGAFAYNEIESIEFPNTLVKIGSSAFTENKLTTVKIPDSVEIIAYRAFFDNDLTSVDLGHGVQYIYDESFYMNNITSVTIPSSVKEIWPGTEKYYYFWGAFWRNPMRTVIIEGKESADNFDKFTDVARGELTTPFIFADDVTCIPNNLNSVVNGCITWTGKPR